MTLHDTKKMIIDDALLLYFQAPHSYTGEDMLEIQCHGGHAIYEKIFYEVQELCRPSLPGEFTYRAMINGKLSLAEAQAVHDLVTAQTEEQRKYAINHKNGHFQQYYQQWRDTLLEALAFIEACLDFSDEELPQDTWQQALEKCEKLAHTLDIIANDRTAETLKNGVRIALIGHANVGKSTLLNHIMGRDISLVHDGAGTTRDVIEVEGVIFGYPVIFVDIAGFRHTDNIVERKGIEKALNQADIADIRLFMYDSTCLHEDKNSLTKWVTLDPQRDIEVATKADLINTPLQDAHIVDISCKTSYHLDILYSKITEKIRHNVPHSHHLSFAHQRQRDIIIKTSLYIRQALEQPVPELCVEYIRLAYQHISMLTGHVHHEEMLDTLFSHFCIGK